MCTVSTNYAKCLHTMYGVCMYTGCPQMIRIHTYTGICICVYVAYMSSIQVYVYTRVYVHIWRLTPLDRRGGAVPLLWGIQWSRSQVTAALHAPPPPRAPPAGHVRRRNNPVPDPLAAGRRYGTGYHRRSSQGNSTGWSMTSPPSACRDVWASRSKGPNPPTTPPPPRTRGWTTWYTHFGHVREGVGGWRET